MAKGKSNGFGIASLVLGIMSVLFSAVLGFGSISAILGIIFSTKQKTIFPSGIATAGLVTSIIGLVLSLLALITWKVQIS